VTAAGSCSDSSWIRQQLQTPCALRPFSPRCSVWQGCRQPWTGPLLTGRCLPISPSRGRVSRSSSADLETAAPVTPDSHGHLTRACSTQLFNSWSAGDSHGHLTMVISPRCTHARPGRVECGPPPTGGPVRSDSGQIGDTVRGRRASAASSAEGGSHGKTTAARHRIARDAPLVLVVPTCGQPTWKKDGSMVEEG
jgi:hypothetical protein